LLKAVDAYDPSSHDRFEPYAMMRIRGAILDELRSIDVMTRHGRRRLAEVTKAIRELTQRLGRQPTEEEIADSLGLPLEEYQKLSEALARGPALGQLGSAEPDDVASGDIDPGLAFDDKELRTRLAGAIGELPERMQTVLALYYQEECTQAEIGRILDVTESRVCQILGEASARLRAILEGDAPVTKKKKAK
jgi:RNA polymerase sigma factor for flagellar operon FliA